MDGGKVSYGGALLLRSKTTMDDNEQVSPHIQPRVIRQWVPVAPGGARPM